MAQPVVRLTQEFVVPGSIQLCPHVFVFPPADSRKVVISDWQKYVPLLLV